MAFSQPEARPVPPAAWIALGLASTVVAALAVTLGGPAVGVFLIVGSLAVVGVVAAPGVILAAYLLIPFYKAALNDYSPVDLTVILALANAAQVVPLVLDSRQRSFARVGVALWLGLGLLVLGGVLYAPDQSLALGKAVSFWLLVILAIFPAAVRVGAEPRYVNQFLAAFFAMGVITVALGIAQLSGSEPLVVLGMNTIQVSRAALLVPILGVAFLLPRGRLMLTARVCLLIPASVVVAVASGSRGPLLMLVVIGVLGVIRYVVTDRARVWRLIGGAIGLLLVSLLVLSTAAPALPASALTRFVSLAEFVQGGFSTSAVVQGGETSAAARVSFARFAVEMFADHPLVGEGTAGFQVLHQAALGPNAATYPHNAILQVAAEHGLLGLALFVGLIAFALLRTPPGSYTGIALRALALFFILNAMVSGDIFTDRESLGLILLLLVLDSSKVVSTKQLAAQGSPRPPTQRWLSASERGVTYAGPIER
jgi:O-antigen ligase